MSENVFVDPWLHNQKPEFTVPEQALFCCAYDIYCNPFDAPYASFLYRTGTRGELWVVEDFSGTFVEKIEGSIVPLRELARTFKVKIGLACAMSVTENEVSASLRLLDTLFREMVPAAGPSRFLKSGTVSEPAYNDIVARILQELDDNKQKALDKKSALVEAARKLGLNPKPLGTAPHHWQANCPGGKHHLLISSETNTFGCGYCKCEGGMEELRQFAKDQKKKHL